MPRRPAPITQSDISRAIRAVRDAGFPVTKITVRPNGEVVVETVEPTAPVAEADEPQDANRIVFL